jgi:hypothetical protein
MALIIRQIRGSRPREGYFLGEITFDSSYPTGGESLTAASLGFAEMIVVQFGGGTYNYKPEYDYANSKVVLNGAFGEVDNASDQSSVTVRFVAFGAPA